MVPRLIYHDYQSFLDRTEQGARLPRIRRQPISTLTLSILLGVSLAGLGTGTALLLSQSKHYPDFREAIVVDTECLETSTSHLQYSLSSLAEAVLQNRRVLDLVFLQQGGLCAALGEECCFYTGHSGLVKDSTAKVQEGLTERKKELGSQSRMVWVMV